MLYSKEQLYAKIDEFKAYCKDNSPEIAGATGAFNWDSFFSPLYASINAYFTADMSDVSNEVNFLIEAMYADLLRRTTKHEFDYQFKFNISTNYPQGYSDLRDCFHDFSNIINTSNETFFNSCILDITAFTIKSDLRDSWIAAIGTAHTSDYEKVSTLANWCADTGSCCDLINLLENRGKILEINGTRENAKIIYIDRHVLEVIRLFNLTSYIPTYYEGV